MQYCSVHVRKYHCMLFYFFPCLCIYDASELQIPLHRKSPFLWNNRYLVQVTGSVSILSVFLKTDLYPYNQFQFQPYGLINSRTITFHSYGNMSYFTTKHFWYKMPYLNCWRKSRKSSIMYLVIFPKTVWHSVLTVFFSLKKLYFWKYERWES